MAEDTFQISYANPLTAPFQSIDSSGIDYSAYDKDSYLWDNLQNAWNYFFGGDSNWGDSQAVDNRQKAEEYAKNIFGGNSGHYNDLTAQDYQVADKIRQMYDVDQDKGIELLTGAMNWVGDQLYDNMTGSDDSIRILRDLMQGGTSSKTLYDSNGNEVNYTLGQDLYNAIVDDDYDYVDNVLRTIGSDLSKSGKNWGDIDKNTMNDLWLHYNDTLGRTNGNYKKNLEALENGEPGSTIVKGDRDGSLNGIIFTENGKYNPLAGNSHAANFLDTLDIASTAIPVLGQAGKVTKIPKAGKLIDKGIDLVTKGTKGAEATAKGAKGAEAAAGAAAPVANAVDAANAARGSVAANNAAAAAANAARTTTPASGGITANAADLANAARASNPPSWASLYATSKSTPAVPDAAEAANKAATAAKGAQAADEAATVAPAAAEAANDSRIMQNIGNLADSAKGRVNDFRLNRDVRKAQKDFAKAQKQGSKAKGTEAANDTLDYSKFDKDVAQRLMGDIATGKTPELNTDAEKATWAILQSQAPSARSRVINNAKNVGKFMTNPKNIYLGNSVSDIVSSPIEEARRNEQGIGTSRNNPSTGFTNGFIIPRVPNPNAYRDMDDWY